MAYIGWIIF
ncbi:hypothetical protein F383_33222 [Gossypium arboreum]|uniref:Uncharacterized protein n=1 Tax=Gossypium arboreum TaxID=29729 RepID=A0A0B0PU15_GOSAR|nr:hypothetical protein F383_33222 [Gossypium arboreum]